METDVLEKKTTKRDLFWWPKTENGEKLSDPFGVIPLIKGQVVKYKLVDSDKDDPTRTEVVEKRETNKHLKQTPGHSIVGKKEIFDSISGQTITILNKGVRKKIKTPMGEIVTERPESIKFTSDKPIITVKWNEPEKYAFMERINENVDNPHRIPGSKAIFYRMDPQKKADKEAEKTAFEFTACKWVMEEAKFDTLVACAKYLNGVRPELKLKTEYKTDEMSVGFTILKKQLYDIAKADPKNVLKGSTKTEAVFEMQVRDAETFSLIMYGDGKVIKMKDKEGLCFHNDVSLTTICTVAPGKNKYEAILEFFAKDAEGKKHYTKMVESLQKVLTPR
jgi:hypothetical protein